ncbi:hypothetical protein TKK_0011982 [Trichogramma kaykai]|uniref:Tetratricopeptide repeat protein 25 n=1 Tax=Trichogramma kaykai TaxID=54128 RepID=A0ABD2WPH5_9HYME
MIANDDDENKLFNGQVLYREWGRRFCTLGRYLKSIDYYELSKEFGEENFIWTLLGLAEALKKSGQFAQANEVAQQCMNIDANHLGAYWTRMGALYDIGEFCESLIYAHRGLKRRSRFREAVLLANETVEDCCGVNVPGDVLLQMQPWIERLGKHREELTRHRNEGDDEFAEIGEHHMLFTINDPEEHLRHKHRLVDRMLAAFYLEKSADDKNFLLDMTTHPGLRIPNEKGSESVTKATKDCLTRLKSQQEAIRTRRPLYAVRYKQEAQKTKGLKLAEARELQLNKCLRLNSARYVLRQIHQTRLAKDYDTFFRLVEIARERFAASPLSIFPERMRFLDALYRMSARAYMDPRDLRQFQAHQQREKNNYIRRAIGLKGSKLPKDSDLAWPRCLNIRQAFAKCRQRLALSRRKLERLWLLHEICKLFMQIKRFDLARFYAKKTRDLSIEWGHDDWALNACHALLRIEAIQLNRPEAKEAAEATIEYARKLDCAYLVDFYEQTVRLLETSELGQVGDDDGIAKREQLINKLMPDYMKPRMDRLFRAMGSLPANRRLSVMPGCNPLDPPGKKKSTKVTVQSGPPEDEDNVLMMAMLKKYAPSKAVPGTVDFSQYDC